MKKRFTILAAAFTLLAFLAIPMGMRGQTRDVETFTFSELGFGNAEDVTAVEGDNVTLTFAQGTNANNAPKYYTTGSAVRMYTGNTLEVALNNQEGETRITAIDFTFVSNSYAGSLQNWTGSETSVSFTNTASGQARIQVIAVTFSEGGTPTPTTYTVTYDCNGGTSGCPENVTGIEAGAQILLAAAPTKTDYTFDGWNDGTTTYQAGANYTVNGNVTFTAQWTEIVSGDEQWVLTNLADLTASDVFVIVGNNGSDYAMSNDGGTTSAPSAVAVTVTGNEITSSVASTIKWTVSGDATNGYIFYPNGSTETWLYCTNTNNGVRVGANMANTFKMEATSGYLVHQGTSRYIGIYNSQDWRCYTSINSNIQGQTFAFYKKVTGGVIPPSITAANVDIAYNATSGSIAYTINNGVTGGIMSVATESDWLTLGQGTTSPISFTCSTNEGAAERTATVTLTYTYNRATATANVTVTQAGNPNVIDNISDITATGVDYAVIGTVVAASARGFVMGDGTGYVYTYLNAIPEVAVGDIKKISGTMGSYNHVLQFTNTATIEDATNSNYNNTPAIQVLDATGIGTYSEGLHLSDYVQIEGMLSISDNYYNIAVDGLTSTASISYPTDAQKAEMTDLDNKHVIVKGYFAGVSSGHFNVLLGTIEEVVSAEPSITIVNPTVNVPVEGAEGTLTVYYENIEEMVANVYFCDAEGDAASYDWIYAEVDDDNNLYYSINSNDGEARTAYLKVYEGNTNTYSNLVTINQAAYVAPTYAELPFSFDGGKEDIEGTDGLYQEGLDTDYGSSPKLKFNTTGDYVLLQFQEEPGTLTFDIKANPSQGSWAGTFTVLTSSDGISYTEKASYSDISTTTVGKTISDLASDVRYIKWVYTKVTGNVALGNIVLNEYTEPVPAIILDTYAIDVPAEGGEGDINVTYQNINLGEGDIYVNFVDESGEYSFEYDWITAEIDANNNVHFVVDANQGDARIAYFKVEFIYNDDYEGDLKFSRYGNWTAGYESDMITVTQAAYVAPFEPATYTLATTIESGKTYIIVGSKEIEGETHYYAMGEQGDHNRPGVAISVAGTTATVETAEVHEFIVTDTLLVDWDKDGGSWNADPMYSIYDTKGHGFLYASSSTANHLKTETDLDSNGLWTINNGEGDGQFSIVAQGSNTRNVMRFNYNGGNTLFSCYDEVNNQLPVYLYVKEEATTTVTQTITLTAGTNWVSTYVEITKEDLQNALVAALSNPAGTVIKSQNGNSTYRGGRWRDQSFTWDVAKMYKIVVPEDCVITLTGTPINPAEHPITIAPNAPTWIGFPFAESMTPAQAIPAGFAVNADIIKGKDGNARYGNGNWRAQGLNSLEPGKGYMYVSGASATEERTLVYPSAK